MTDPVVLLIDPPWVYTNKKTGASMNSGADAKYGTLSIAQLEALDLTAFGRPAILFMWATVPLGELPYEVMSAWGFTYKTSLFWKKTGRLGMGHWLRGQVEPLHIGIAGQVKPFKSSRRNIVELPSEGHSVKPDLFHTIIEELVPKASRRVELFARRPRAGWETYGLELGQDFLDSEIWNEVVAGKKREAA